VSTGQTEQAPRPVPKKPDLQTHADDAVDPVAPFVVVVVSQEVQLPAFPIAVL
jgi:hypothetical protein